MVIREIAKQTGRGLVAAAALFAVASIAAPQPAGAVDTGTAVGIGLGAAALGAAVGANATPITRLPTIPITRRRRPATTRPRRRPATTRRRAAAGIRIIGATTPADPAA